MENLKKHQEILAFIAGIMTAFALYYLAYPLVQNNEYSHPIGYSDTQEEVHVHSDFIVYLDGQQYDLTADKYQTTNTHSNHAHIHLHDNVGHVIHRHEHNVTLGEFFNSLGFGLTNDCITTDTNQTFCTDETNQLLLFVNGKTEADIVEYVNKEEDELLLFYGDPEDTVIPNLLEEIPDDSCYYSGTCPERGIAPNESCGLTCEL